MQIPLQPANEETEAQLRQLRDTLRSLTGVRDAARKAASRLGTTTA